MSVSRKSCFKYLYNDKHPFCNGSYFKCLCRGGSLLKYVYMMREVLSLLPVWIREWRFGSRADQFSSPISWSNLFKSVGHSSRSPTTIIFKNSSSTFIGKQSFYLFCKRRFSLYPERNLLESITNLFRFNFLHNFL